MKNKLWVRIITWVLVILMIGSCAYVLLANLFAAHAQESAPDYITVGLMYGSDVTVGFETVSTVGFSVQETVTGAERSFHEIYTIEVPKISVVCDDSLSKSAYTYSILSGDKKCAVGGYHLEVHEDFDTLDEALEMLDIILEKLEDEDSDMQPFLAYIDGVYKVRIGNFAERSDVAKNAATIPELKSEITLVAALPSDTGVSVVDPETDEILFEYDCGASSSLGLTALPRGREKQYLKTPANRLYDGVFVYSRYKTEDTDGVQLVNMLDMEDYIAGVVPYEINPNWEYEALRAFSITVRSYTAKNKRRHSAYGFDLCNTTHCQVYRGITSANDSVFDAVASTKGMVLAAEDKIADIYYSSSMGGYTVSAKDTWGGSDSAYLTSVPTPWERYSEYNNGLWITEVSGEELADYLREKGYDELTGRRIVDIEIESFAGDSPYVYSITYTDSKGNELTVSRCDKVRTSISKYVKSANFIVGQGELEYTYDEVQHIDMDSPFSFTTGNYSALTEIENKVLNALGVSDMESKRIYVQSADGVSRIPYDEAYVATGSSGVYASVDDVPGVILRRRTEVVTAEDSDNFLFVGKGWGHGVGISQYGTLDLAKAGATAEQILALYFPETELCDYLSLR